MSSNNQAGSGDAEFDAFAAAGSVEIGESNLASQEEKSADTSTPSENDADDGADGADTNDTGENDAGDDDNSDAGDDEKPQRKKQTPSERIRELNKRFREEERRRQALEERLARIEQTGLQQKNSGGNQEFEIGDAPDPTDTEKYPLGHLDDRYIEDKLEWVATKKAIERAEAVLQRQQETEQQAAIERQQTELRQKVDDIAVRGGEQFDDFQERVVETAMKGAWPLTQTTFEAAFEATNGAQILHELATNPTEAARVAKLSNFAQLKYVQERDAALTTKPRNKPSAGAPPTNLPRGANSKVQISPATDNLDDFEKLWEADARARRH